MQIRALVLSEILACAFLFSLASAKGTEIHGTVTLVGVPPTPVVVDLSKYPECTQIAKGTLRTRHYVVSSNGGLANVFVYIRDGLGGNMFSVSTNKPVLEQRDLGFQPYVMGVQTGQKFIVKNSEPYTDTVHALSRTNREFNIAQLPGQTNEFRFNKPEVLLQVRCEMHPWEFAFIGVVEHPFFGVTDADGSFALPTGVPDGNYVIAAVHPKLGVQTQEVCISDAECQELGFNFQVKSIAIGD